MIASVARFAWISFQYAQPWVGTLLVACSLIGLSCSLGISIGIFLNRWNMVKAVSQVSRRSADS
jgi:ABC-type phosphate transport system permease subunit